MKIEKIVLKNFSAIYSAMDTHYLSIDFQNAKNTVCLLIGPNGSGKTTIMSLLTPFSNLGNLDVRDGNALILENEEGYKEIQIRDGKNLYTIKHFYTPRKEKSHMVKSYIEKNGVELNSNGNVSSFKEYVKIELGIEPDYLKLIRLGSNVTSMIDLTETERKTFMSRLLDDIGVSLSYYKKVNGDIRQLKQMISLNTEKMRRLGIDDIMVETETIHVLEGKQEEEQKRYGLLSGDLSVHQHELDKIENKETLRVNLSKVVKKVKKMEDIMKRKEDLVSTEVSYYIIQIDQLNKKKIQLESEIQTTQTLMQHTLSEMDNTEDQLRILKVELQKENESDSELSKMKEEYRKLKVEFSYRSHFYETYQPPCTKQEFEKFVVFLKNTQQILNKTYEFGDAPVHKVIELIKKKKNVTTYINAGIMNLNEEAEKENSYLLTILSKKFSFHNTSFQCDRNDCPAKSLWKQISDLLENKSLEKKKEDYEFYRDVELCYENITAALSSFSEWDTLFSKLPENIKKEFTLEEVYKKILNNALLYDEETIEELLSLLTEYEDIDKIRIEIEELERDIEKFEKLSNLDYLKKQKKYYEEKMEELEEEMSSFKNTISKKSEVLKDVQFSLDSMEELKETFEKYDELKELMKELESSYDSYQSNTSAIVSLQKEIRASSIMIQKYGAEIQTRKTKLSQYKELKKEMKKFEKIYDEMILVKDALSSKTGMPLYHIKQYFGNTEEITNELLDIAYGGDIYIDKFHITPTEFQIPYYVKGKRMKDVKYASQGELSFLSIALSFGLSSQSLSRYNIMLLDEIDGPLDNRNREKFIRILENQIDRIGSEQSFLITHNNMFSSYPVDIIDLSFDDEHKNEYKLANYITISKEEN